MKVLDIGCGSNKYDLATKYDQVIGLDKKHYPTVDVIHDAENVPLPFDDESFDMVYMNHTIEHIENRMNLIDDIWRILKCNGRFVCIVPHRTNPISAEVDHKIVGLSLHGFDDVTFDIIKKDITLLYPFGLLSGFVVKFPDFYEWWLSRIAPAVEIRFEMVKGGYVNGDAIQ